MGEGKREVEEGEGEEEKRSSRRESCRVCRRRLFSRWELVAAVVGGLAASSESGLDGCGSDVEWGICRANSLRRGRGK